MTIFISLAVVLVAVGIYLFTRAKYSERVIHTQHAEKAPLPKNAVPEGTPEKDADDGEGPYFHRRYWIDVHSPRLSGIETLEIIKSDFNKFSPAALAVFEKTKGDKAVFAVGDEYLIKITGPWNGRVKVINNQKDEFTFATTLEHFESGQIAFKVIQNPQSKSDFRFEISSWARSSDKIVNLTYDILGIAKFAQTQMWSLFCQNVAKVAEGSAPDQVQIVTERAPKESTPEKPNAAESLEKNS